MPPRNARTGQGIGRHGGRTPRQTVQGRGGCADCTVAADAAARFAGVRAASLRAGRGFIASACAPGGGAGRAAAARRTRCRHMRPEKPLRAQRGKSWRGELSLNEGTGRPGRVAGSPGRPGRRKSAGARGGQHGRHGRVAGPRTGHMAISANAGAGYGSQPARRSSEAVNAASEREGARRTEAIARITSVLPFFAPAELRALARFLERRFGQRLAGRSRTRGSPQRSRRRTAPPTRAGG